MRCTDQKRIAVAVAGWGALGTLIIRAVNFLDWMKRPDALVRVLDFFERHGERGAVVLAAYNEANPFSVAFGVDISDAYVDYAERFMELWASRKYALVGSHGRAFMLIRESFSCCGYSERAYLRHVGNIADKIWWRGGFSA